MSPVTSAAATDVLIHDATFSRANALEVLDR
jgi:hypothetical protein